MSAPPVQLPVRPDLLLDPEGLPHPLILSGQLKLMAWMVSGKDGIPQVSPNKLQLSSDRPGQIEPINDIPQLGGDGVLGAKHGVLILWGHSIV